jgi:LacI family transcriptional regulator
LVDRSLQGFELDTVLCDGEPGVYQAVRHLLETGRRRVGMITLSLDISTGRDRLDGYRRALTDAGVGVDEDMIALGGRGERDGYEGAIKLLSSPGVLHPDALFISSHLMTVGALKALRERGLRVPQDVAVIGFDELPWMSLMAPPLTVVSQPAYEMGAQAAGVLISRLTGEQAEPAQRIVLPTELVHRASCCVGGDEDS